MTDSPFTPQSVLDEVVEQIRAAETQHRTKLAVREDFQHRPTHCTCGRVFDEDNAVEQEYEHRLQVRALAAMVAMSRPCDHCGGDGRIEADGVGQVCPGCGGFGKTLSPLPPMQFLTPGGYVWHVVPERLDGKPGGAWIGPVRPEG